MGNKICVYAICKNESKFVERWLDSVSEADYVVVLDTGSTDDTYEKLKKDSRITKVEQKIIKPWRFDVARNESLKLVPEDANILVCVDLDEIIHSGWADILKNNWIEGKHTRCNYKYIWSHNADGFPGRIFWQDKIHSRGWEWENAVHETLKSDNLAYVDLNIFDQFTIEHFADNTKSRSSYLPLLRQRAIDNPTDYYGLFYLTHEYYYQSYYHESIALLHELYNNHKEIFSIQEQSSMFVFMGDNYRSLGDPMKSLFYYNKAIQIDPTYREPYLYAAEICNELKMYRTAIGYVEDAISNSYRHYTWIERDDTWNEKIFDILSVSYYWIGNYNLAMVNINKAIERNKSNMRLLENKKLIADKIKEGISNG